MTRRKKLVSKEVFSKRFVVASMREKVLAREAYGTLSRGLSMMWMYRATLHTGFLLSNLL